MTIAKLTELKTNTNRDRRNGRGSRRRGGRAELFNAAQPLRHGVRVDVQPARRPIPVVPRREVRAQREHEIDTPHIACRTRVAAAELDSGRSSEIGGHSA